MIDECENLESGGFGLEDILSLDATGQLQALAALRISARELLEASVVRTDRLNPKLNAVVSRDLDRAYASAQLIDDRRARHESLGRLAGLPMTVKDALDVEGLPASAGIERLLRRTTTDAAVVSRVRAEGAITRRSRPPIGRPITQSTGPPTIHGTWSGRRAALRADQPRYLRLV